MINRLAYQYQLILDYYYWTIIVWRISILVLDDFGELLDYDYGLLVLVDNELVLLDYYSGIID